MYPEEVTGDVGKGYWEILKNPFPTGNVKVFPPPSLLSMNSTYISSPANNSLTGMLIVPELIAPIALVSFTKSTTSPVAFG